MKFALIADIHGNLLALEAALADIAAQGVSNGICLGDVASFGPEPKATLKRIRALGWPVVMGNTDAYLLKPRTLADVKQPNEETAFFLDLEAWSAEQLDEADRDYIRTFPLTYRLEHEGLSLLAYHGSPKDFHDPILATTSDETLAQYFEACQADLFAGGHTHTPFIRLYRESRVLNPGSIGFSYLQDKKTQAFINLPVAEYALVELEQGEANIRFRRVRYRLKDLHDRVETSAMPYAKRWLADFRPDQP